MECEEPEEPLGFAPLVPSNPSGLTDSRYVCPTAFGAPRRIRTYDPRIRSPMLYPAELGVPAGRPSTSPAHGGQPAEDPYHIHWAPKARRPPIPSLGWGPLDLDGKPAAGQDVKPNPRGTATGRVFDTLGVRELLEHE
jgi:hypothetical protein